MAIEDSVKQGLVARGTNAPVIVSGSQGVNHRVEISTVREVSGADWKKAHEVAEIVARAGLSPHLVTNALIVGHDYPGKSFALEDVPMSLENKVGEVGCKGDTIISWRVEEAKNRLLEGGKTFINSDSTSLVVAERLPDVISDTSPAKVIRMAVIIKKETVEVPRIEQPKEEDSKVYSFGPLPLDKVA